MQSNVKTPDEYLAGLDKDRQAAMQQLRDVINQNLPKGFSEEMSYGMLGWVVPHTLYPPGYHCNPNLPLPFLSIASQKNFIAVYHMGLYADEDLYNWFIAEYPKHSTNKLDMGKSCMRFKKPETIPYELIGKLVVKITPQQWIELYETNLKK